jgi:putative FmdB family regulatory protein
MLCCGTICRASFPCFQVNIAMPIYEFECPSCAHRFERLQKVSDADPKDCPECGKQGVRRRLTAPAFRLSGSGWYETDFKKDGDTKRNLASSETAEKPVAADTSAKSEPAKTETGKPESKPSAASEG